MFAPLNAACSPSPKTTAKGSWVFKVKLSSQSKSDWLAGSLTTAKVIAAGAECLLLPLAGTGSESESRRPERAVRKEALSGRVDSASLSVPATMITTVPKTPLTYENGMHSTPAAITFAVSDFDWEESLTLKTQLPFAVVLGEGLHAALRGANMVEGGRERRDLYQGL
ncbi:hypothetical protein DFH09DRAFT_1082463 [Mycena vulgaris]|nr:hypothetical protein DFH09DRAFT_1082463 [Mycena vulgaris]